MRFPTLLSATAALALVPALAGATEIPLSVDYGFSLPTKQNIPITSGIPISNADTSSSWALFDSGNHEIPVQTTLLRGRLTPWLLVDFQGSGLTTATYTLKTQSPTVSAAPGLVVTDSSSFYTVTTGPLKVRIGKSTFNLFDEVWLDRNHSGTFSDSTGRQEQLVSTTTSDNLAMKTADDTVVVGRRAPIAMTWEDLGALRSTLKVDGYYARSGSSSDTLLFYTTRITFYAGKAYVDVEHVIRNSVLDTRRYVKVKSCRLVTNGGGTLSRARHSGDHVWILPSGGAASLEIVPWTFKIISDLTTDQVATYSTINTDTNGGIVIPDWSYQGASARFDFCDSTLVSAEQANRANNYNTHRFATVDETGGAWYAPKAALGAKSFGTLEDETAANDAWGWATPSSPNAISEPDTSFYPNWTDITTISDLKADDVWMNLMMFVRTKQVAFLHRADAWARYYKWEYAWRTDGFSWVDSSTCVDYVHRVRNYLGGTYTDADKDYLWYSTTTSAPGNTHPYRGGKDDGGRNWSGGLVDYYYMTGDRDALAAAGDVAEHSWCIHAAENTSNMEGNDIRSYARAYLSQLRVYDATSAGADRSRADLFRTMFLHSNWWDPRGFFYEPTYRLGGDYITRFPHQYRVTPFMAGMIPHVLYVDWQLSGSVANDSLSQRIKDMAAFAYQYGANADTAFTGSEMVMDSTDTGIARHLSFSIFRDGLLPWWSPPQTSVDFLDALTLGYRFTGNECYLTKARDLWARSTKYDSTAQVVDDSHAGRWLNDLGGNGNALYFDGHQGDLPWSQYYLHDAAAGDFVAPAAVSDLAIATGRTTAAVVWTAPGDDGDTGQAAAYDLRRSTSTITDGNFASATSITTSTPATAGSDECAALTGLTSCTTYYFALKTRDACGHWSALSNVASGATKCSGSLAVDCGGMAVVRAPKEDADVPDHREFSVEGKQLVQGSAKIQLGFPTSDAGRSVELSVFDIAGRKLRVLYSGAAVPGRHPIEWDLRGRSGEAMRAGAYFLSLRVADSSWNRKIMVVR